MKSLTLSPKQQLARDCIKQSPLTLRHIAKISGVAESTIEFWISGRSEPRQYNLDAVYQAATGIIAENRKTELEVESEIKQLLKKSNCAIVFTKSAFKVRLQQCNQ